MKLTQKELDFFIGYLEVRRMYKPTGHVLGSLVWEDWMEDTLKKLTDERYP